MTTQPLSGKTAVITGGGTGIGEGIAITFARAGMNVVICGRRSEPLARVVKLIEQDGGTAMDFQADVTNQEGVELCMQDVAFGSHGRLILLDLLQQHVGVAHADRAFEEQKHAVVLPIPLLDQYRFGVVDHLVGVRQQRFALRGGQITERNDLLEHAASAAASGSRPTISGNQTAAHPEHDD